MPDLAAGDPVPEAAQPFQPALGGLPAMIAELTAPIETPDTQSGSIPTSCKASNTPA
jgi:hypothetical protein